MSGPNINFFFVKNAVTGALVFHKLRMFADV